MALSKEDREELIEVLNIVLDQRSKIDSARHKAHHDFVQYLWDNHRANQERWKKFQTSFIGAAAVGTMAALGWVGTAIIEYVKNHWS